MPGFASGIATTQRHEVGNITRASSGDAPGADGRCPPSTTNPPPANVHVPTADRRARPTDRASSGIVAATPCSSASASAMDRASCVPEPSPECAWDRVLDDDRRTTRESVVREETTGELRGAVGVVAARLEGIGQRRPRRAS